MFTKVWLVCLLLSILAGNSMNTNTSHLLIYFQCCTIDYVTSTSCIDNRAQGGPVTPVTSIVSYCACCVLFELHIYILSQTYRFPVKMFPCHYQE